MSESQEMSSSTADPLFNDKELEQFSSDDTDAGRAIGKMLSFFFLYTIVVMSMAAWWTFASVAE